MRLRLLLPLWLALLAMTGCTAKEAIKAPVNVLGMLFGRIPPPAQTTVLQELHKEYEKCVGDGGSEPECSQLAYETVRVGKGLDKPPLPTGTVTVRADQGSSATGANTPATSATEPTESEPAKSKAGNSEH